MIQSKQLYFKPSTQMNVDVYLSPNSFIDYTDAAGFFEAEKEPIEWLSVTDFVDTQLPASGKSAVRYPGSEDTSYSLPEFTVNFKLGTTRNDYERSPYTFFTLLGDIGGFYEAILLLPTFLMSFYSASMFQKSLTSDLPV